MDEVYIVLNLEAGWDCILGVFKELDSVKDYIKSELEIEDNSTKCNIIDNATYVELDQFLVDYYEMYAVLKHIVS